MAINYKVLKCKNPNGVEGTTYAFCGIIKTSGYNFKRLVFTKSNSLNII